jgi:uncharacterized protein
MHDSGLVHVSQLANKFVRDPHDVVAVGDIVKVWVVEIDKERRRVSLTMIKPGTEGPATRRRGKGERPARGKPPQRPQRAEGERRPKPKGPPRRRGPAPRHRPKRPQRPVTPLTEEMKTGKEPLRSFSDLAQFFHLQEETGRDGNESQRAEDAGPKPPDPEDDAADGKP